MYVEECGCTQAAAGAMASLDRMMGRGATREIDMVVANREGIQKLPIDALKLQDQGQVPSERTWSAWVHESLTQGQQMVPDVVAKFASQVRTNLDYVKRNPMQALAYTVIMALNPAVGADARFNPTSSSPDWGSCKTTNFWRTCPPSNSDNSNGFGENCLPCTSKVGNIAGVAAGAVVLSAAAVGLCCYAARKNQSSDTGSTNRSSATGSTNQSSDICGDMIRAEAIGDCISGTLQCCCAVVSACATS